MSIATAQKIKQGTFIGDGTINVSLNVGFEPDYVIVERESKILTIGMQNVSIIKGRAVYNSICYTSSSSGLVTICYGTYISENDDVWGHSSTSTYRSYATYANGILTISNNTNSTRSSFISGDKYTWIAIKI